MYIVVVPERVPEVTGLVDLTGGVVPGKLAVYEPCGAENGVEAPVPPAKVDVGVGRGTGVAGGAKGSVGVASTVGVSLAVGVALAMLLAARLAAGLDEELL